METEIAAEPILVDEAIVQTGALEDRLADAARTVDEVTTPSSEGADTLKRGLTDTSNVNRLLRAEFGMRKLVVRWSHGLLDGLRKSPPVIRAALDMLRLAVDVTEMGWNRFDEFTRDGVNFVIGQIRQTIDTGEAILARV